MQIVLTYGLSHPIIWNCRMKAKFLLFIGITAIIISGYSQPCHTKTYEKEPKRFFTPGFDSLCMTGNYRESIIKIQNDTASLNYKSYYHLAVNYALLEEIDSAFLFLDKYLKCSPDDRIVFVDYRLQLLRTDTSRWRMVQHRIEQSYLNLLDTTYNKELALILFYMGIDDQKYRSLLPYSNPSLEPDSSFIIKTKESQSQFIQILKNYGFPSIDLVGKLGSTYAFLIYQHINPEFIIKYYPYIKKSFENHSIDSVEFAMATDRYLLWKNKKQIYGTQCIRSTETEKYFPGKTILYPTKDFQNVNKRRIAMGFKETVEEYAERLGAIIPEEYYYGKEKMKWVR